VAAALLACVTFAPLSAQSAEQDLNLWSVFSIHHEFDDRWAASFQTEVRAQDDISEMDAVILKPGAYYAFSKVVSLGVGYKWQDKFGEANEHDLWQELYVNHALGDFRLGHQFRMEERFIGDVDGAIARLRYLFHVDHPINEKWYLAASEAIRFNLNDQGEGPVQGFEQNRAYFGVGRRVGTLNVELGYLWRYERERTGPDASDHVIRFQFHFDTKARPPKHLGN
jgi:hypothetical protein